MDLGQFQPTSYENRFKKTNLSNKFNDANIGGRPIE